MEDKVGILPHLSCENSRESTPRCSVSCRSSLALLGCLGFCVVYSLRVNLSVALVAMVNNTYDHSDSKRSTEVSSNVTILICKTMYIS